MEIYLGKDPESLEALEFLCLAEEGGITRYEVLNAMASEIKFSIDAQRIRAEKSSTEIHRISKTDNYWFSLTR